MEEFLLQNTERFAKLLAQYKPESVSSDKTEGPPNRDAIVCARIRPLRDDEEEIGFPSAVFHRSGSAGTVDAHELRRPVRGPPPLKSAKFQVDHAYGPESSTEHIYEDVVKQLVPWAWGGGIGTLFAYGQTGSGKTFTVSALEKLVAQQLMDGSLGNGRQVHVSIVDLAGNSAHDLLNGRRPISVLEDSFGVTQLAGAVEKHVTTTAEILELIETAAKFRRTESTTRNDTSSRSHAICRIRIQIDSMNDAEDGILYLVDLAGSEAARDVAAHGADRMREAREINTSLSVLKDCIRGKTESDALLGAASKRKPHVPFRQSALTKILKHVFDPAGLRSCKTVVMACVNPCLADTGASKNTLRYAEMLRVSVPKTKVKFDPSSPMTWTNAQLRDWIDKNSGSPPVSSSILAPDETGLQLLRMPAPEFEMRCLKTEGVSPEQAKAFKSKYWRQHTDSQRSKVIKPSAGEADGEDTVLGHLKRMNKSTSHDVVADTSSVPFKQRIRPGMVVACKLPQYKWIGYREDIHFAMIQCPIEAVTTEMVDAIGNTIKPGDAGDGGGSNSQRYLCTLVSPGVAPESYEINLWSYCVMEVDWMDREVILEYDTGCRYYYVVV